MSVKRLTCRVCGGRGITNELFPAFGPTDVCAACDGTGEVEPCVVCGTPSVVDYDDRVPSCGRARCELCIQYAEDYYSKRG